MLSKTGGACDVFVTGPDWAFFTWKDVKAFYGAPEEVLLATVPLKKLTDNIIDMARLQRVQPDIEIEADVDSDSRLLEMKVKGNTFFTREHVLAVFKETPFGSRATTKGFVKLPSIGLFGLGLKFIQALPYSVSIHYGMKLAKGLPMTLETSYGGKKWVFAIGASVNQRTRRAKPVCNLISEEESDETSTVFMIKLPYPHDLPSSVVVDFLKRYAYYCPGLALSVRVGVSEARFGNGFLPPHLRAEAPPPRGDAAKIRPSILDYSEGEFVDALFALCTPHPEMTVTQFITGENEWRGFKGLESRRSVKEVLSRMSLDGDATIGRISRKKAKALYATLRSKAESLGARAVLSRDDLLCLGGQLTSPEGRPGFRVKQTKLHLKPAPWLMQAALVNMGSGRDVTVALNGSPMLTNPFDTYNLSHRGRKWSSTGDLMADLKVDASCVMNLVGVIEPLSMNKAEIDAMKYFDEYQRLLCSSVYPLLSKRKRGRKEGDLTVWLRGELVRRKAILEEKGAMPGSEVVLQQSLWYKGRTWYLSTHPKETKPDVNRDYFIASIRPFCKEMNVRREDLGIVATERAVLYFRDTQTGVSLKRIDEVFRAGSDLIVIEKEGVCALLEPFASRYGIALLNSRGQLVDYAEEVVRKARESGSRVFQVTDMDDAGFVIRNNLKGIECIGVDEAMLAAFAKESGKTLPEFKALVQERFHPQFTETLEDWQYRELGWTGSHKPTSNDTLTRVEIDAVLAVVGRESFWNYLLRVMKAKAPVRDLTRSLVEPQQLSEKSLPPAVAEALDALRLTLLGPVEQYIKHAYEPYKEWDGDFLMVEDLEKKISEAAKRSLASSLPGDLVKDLTAIRKRLKERFQSESGNAATGDS